MPPLELELTDEDRDQLLERAAQAVIRRRMEVPAVLALELHRPLTFLGSQALIVFTPMLASAFGLENMQKLSRLLEDRGNIDRLIDRIEDLAAPPELSTTDEAGEGQGEPRDASSVPSGGMSEQGLSDSQGGGCD
jgi:hypothetical protein